MRPGRSKLRSRTEYSTYKTKTFYHQYLMKILVPDYLLASVLRHYGTLANAYRPDSSNTKARNAQRVAGKEIQRLRRIINKQNNEKL